MRDNLDKLAAGLDKILSRQNNEECGVVGDLLKSFKIVFDDDFVTVFRMMDRLSFQEFNENYDKLCRIVREINGKNSRRK